MNKIMEVFSLLTKEEILRTFSFEMALDSKNANNDLWGQRKLMLLDPVVDIIKENIDLNFSLDDIRQLSNLNTLVTLVFLSEKEEFEIKLNDKIFVIRISKGLRQVLKNYLNIIPAFDINIFNGNINSYKLKEVSTENHAYLEMALFRSLEKYE